MNLFTVNVFSIPLGQPLSFSLRNENGVLLARKGHMFFQRGVLHKLAGHGTLWVDMREVNAYQEAIAKQNTGKRDERNSTGTNETSKANAQAGKPKESAIDRDSLAVDWLGLQSSANALLRHPQTPDFQKRLNLLQHELTRLVRRSPDATLLALIHLAAEEDRLYSATHALFVGAVCSLAALEVLDWSEELASTLISAALTMNISITELQDQLAIQSVPLSDEHNSQIDSHAQRSVHLLKGLGISDPVWLEAISNHHKSNSGALKSKSPTEQIARLIHRADVFAARLSPRSSRPSMASLAAMKSAYFDEEQRVDDAGASIIKALGIHHPGALVTLASGDTAVVVRRGLNGLNPMVAVLVNRQGMPLAEPVLRDTSQPEYGIVANINHNSIKVRSDLLRLLAVA